MKKILYDHQMFTFQRYGGVTRYFADLMYNLPQGEFTADAPMKFCENHYVTETYGKKFDKLSFPKNYRIRRRIYEMANDFVAKKAIKDGNYDIFHPTYYNPYFLNSLKKRQKPLVLTIHDMTFERFPQEVLVYDKTIQNKRRLVGEADHIIAVSENTKKDIVEILGADPNKISVVYHGYKPIAEPAPQLFDRYILYVGERKGYKNFMPWLTAIRPLFELDKSLKVVCTGGAFTQAEQSVFAEWGITDRILHIQANDAQMASLYRHALCFVYPSLYEGFGIPILEAFANGCPVCLSNASCFPEVASDAALYFNPNDTDSMYSTMKELLNSTALREELCAKGTARGKDFSIERMVEQTCNVYRKL
ncbi:MAG: glycosyltransferase family 4 protein [Bacteroidaceae bacterium]|nr:glycosyltransferase family 4 protein [Bacteroidaceae bacterium]